MVARRLTYNQANPKAAPSPAHGWGAYPRDYTVASSTVRLLTASSGGSADAARPFTTSAARARWHHGAAGVVASAPRDFHPPTGEPEDHGDFRDDPRLPAHPSRPEPTPRCNTRPLLRRAMPATPADGSTGSTRTSPASRAPRRVPTQSTSERPPREEVGIAAPVRDHRVKAVAVVVLAAPIYRVGESAVPDSARLQRRQPRYSAQSGWARCPPDRPRQARLSSIRRRQASVDLMSLNVKMWKPSIWLSGRPMHGARPLMAPLGL